MQELVVTVIGSKTPLRRQIPQNDKIEMTAERMLLQDKIHERVGMDPFHLRRRVGHNGVLVGPIAIVTCFRICGDVVFFFGTFHIYKRFR